MKRSALMVNKILFGAAGGSFTLSIGLLAVDGARSTGDPKYAFWVCPLAFGAYVTAALALTCLICGILNVPFPGPRRSRSSGPVSGNMLSDEDLRDIKVKVRASASFTDAERDRLLEPYINRLMMFSGTVVNVVTWNGSHSLVKVRPDVRGFTMYLYFADEDVYREQLSITVRKKRMTVIGQISKIGPNEMSFVNCEIVH